MYRAACITSVLHECFLECYNLSVEICSSLTLSFVGHDCSIRQDYSQYVMLWCDKNKVHGFFVFLFCCSFESYSSLELVQPVGALLLAIH